MKMYALFDTSRQKYFTPFENKPFTSKPRVLDTRSAKLEAQVKRYNKKANWEKFGYDGPAPKLKLVEVQATI